MVERPSSGSELSFPNSIAFDPVTTFLLIAYHDGLLIWFALARRAVLSELPTGPHGLGALAVLPRQRSCVGISGLDQAVNLVDLEQATMRQLARFEEEPVCLLPDPATDTLFVACASQHRDLLYTVDGTTGAARNRIPIGRAPKALAIDSHQHVLFVISGRTPSLPLVDTLTGALLNTISLPSTPTGIVVDGVNRQIFVATLKAGVVVLDRSHGDLIKTLASDYVFGAPWGRLALLGGIGIDVDARRVVLGYDQEQSNESPCAVTILDSQTLAVVARHPLPGMVMAVRVHGGKHRAYVFYQTRHGDGTTRARVLTLQVLDTRTGAILHEEVVAKHPKAVLLVESRNQLFIADYDQQAVVCVEDLIP